MQLKIMHVKFSEMMHNYRQISKNAVYFMYTVFFMLHYEKCIFMEDIAKGNAETGKQHG